jgi:hypothetical protein
MDWTECNFKKMVKKVTLDTELIESLKESSQKKLESANRLKIDKITSSSVISLCYESLRELLEALALKKGFKIYNHECFTAFLKEIIGSDDLSIAFDRFRLVRNSINYYAKDISPKDALQLKKEIRELINKIKSKLT